METPIIIIGLVLITVVAIPLYFVLRAHKLDRSQIKFLFAQHSQNSQYKFQLIATQGKKALGLDEQKKALLFIDFNLQDPYVSFQDLKESESCEIATSSPQGKSNPPKRIEWVFTSKKGSNIVNSILFHDTDRNYIVPVYAHEELKLAQEWQQAIQKHL